MIKKNATIEIDRLSRNTHLVFFFLLFFHAHGRVYNHDTHKYILHKAIHCFINPLKYTQTRTYETSNVQKANWRIDAKYMFAALSPVVFNPNILIVYTILSFSIYVWTEKPSVKPLRYISNTYFEY